MFPGARAGRMAEPWRPCAEIVAAMLGYKSIETTPTLNFRPRELAMAKQKECQAKRPFFCRVRWPDSK